MSIRLYVGNLPKEIDRKELQAVFVEAGDSVTAKVITDRKTGKCRGFGFVTVKTEEEADQLIEKYNGYVLKENALKIEKALPRTKGKGEEEARPAAAAPVTSKAASSVPSGGGGEQRSGGGGEQRSGGGGEQRSGGGERSGGGSGERRSSSKKSRRAGGGGASGPSSGSSTGQSEATQPDPRWAQELEKLKQMLAAQTSNP